MRRADLIPGQKAPARVGSNLQGSRAPASPQHAFAALQRSRGNQYVQRVLRGLTQGIDGLNGGYAEETEAEGAPPSAEEEAAPTAQIAVSRSAIPALVKIHRSTTWKAGAVHETINLASMILRGGAPITWHMLNGTKMASEADATSSIKVPAVTTSGAGSAWKAKVDTVPAQEGSFDETVLSAGPWSTAATKAEVGGKTGLAACTGADASTFSANGSPSDDAVYKANRRHEDHHANDHKTAFNTHIGTWDKKVQDAKDKSTEFAGASAADATSALWTAMGGTAADVAKAYRAKGFALGGAYHATPAGGTMKTKSPTANADCSVSAVSVTNPS